MPNPIVLAERRSNDLAHSGSELAAGDAIASTVAQAQQG